MIPGVVDQAQSVKSVRVTPIGQLGISVARGDVAGMSLQNKFGHNDSVSSTKITLWGEGGIYVYPAAATTMTVSSGSTDDASGGTGARTIDIFGLDSTHTEINETITLNGQSGVTTANSYLRIYRMIVRTAGSGGENAGILYVGTGTITSGKPANVYSMTEATENQTLQSFWTVPAGKSFFLLDLIMSVGTGREVEFGLYARPENEVFQIKFIDHIVAAVGQRMFDPSLKFDEKTDIEIRVESSAATTAVAAAFNGYVIDN